MSFVANSKHFAATGTPAVVSVRPNVWRLTFTAADRPSRRPPHGRARWSLSAGSRRQPGRRPGLSLRRHP